MSASKPNGNSGWQKILGLAADPRVEALMGRSKTYAHLTRHNTLKNIRLGDLGSK